MKKGFITAKMIAVVTCLSVLLTSTITTSAASGVLTSIDVSFATDSSQSITELTANDTYQVRDAIYSLTDTSVNRATSEHFQIIWGDGDTTGTVTEDFIRGNLINLENIRTYYVEVLGMKDISSSMNPNISGLYKTNVYISATGLTAFEDDWAYMSVDAGSFGYLFMAPGAMRVDEPSWVVPHELAHVFTYHQGGSITGAWYESVANWFRDRYLGSVYYAYGTNTYGPTSDFFAPYLLNSSYYVPHMLNWYDTWPFFIYISENPDNIDGLGMELMHKIFEYNGANDSMYDIVENLSGVSIKTILAGMTRRLATMDFERQEHYLYRLNTETLTVEGNYEKIYATLESADSEGWQNVPDDMAPMQTGFNIIPLDVDLSMDKIKVEFASTSSDSQADFRTSIVTATASDYTRYSNIIEGDGIAEITLNGDETKAFLVVCATPDELETFYVDWDSSATDSSTRFTYKVRVSAYNEEVETEYNVTVTSDGNGSASADVIKAAEGTIVTLTATSNAGYEFDAWEVTPSTVTITDNKFTMPAGDVTVKAKFKAVSADSTYVGNVNTELNSFSYNPETFYISGEIVVVEWVDGVSTVPSVAPEMTFVGDNGEEIDVFVTPTGTNTYYFDRLLDAGLTEGVNYSFLVTSGDPNNVSEYRTVPVYTTTSPIANEGALGDVGNQTIAYKSATDGTLLVYAAPLGSYVGDVNSSLLDVDCETSALGNFVSGHIVVTEWIDGVSTVPLGTPVMKFKSVDGTEEMDVFMVSVDGTNTYYFDRNLNEEMDVNKEYMFTIELTEENNISSRKSMVVTTNYMDEKSGILWETDTQIIKYKTTWNVEYQDNMLTVYAENK